MRIIALIITLVALSTGCAHRENVHYFPEGEYMEISDPDAQDGIQHLQTWVRIDL